MIETKIIGFFYLIYTIFILLTISITSLEFWSIFSSVLITWIIFIFFSLGTVAFKRKKETGKPIRNVSWLSNQPNQMYLLLMVASIICSFLVVRYYTGQTFISVINNIKNSISTYAEYQKHFAENQISQFSIGKLPFILMMAFVKFNLFYGTFALTLHSDKSQKLNYLKKIYLCISVFSYLYIGIARGTNFEMFEFVVLIITVIFLKNKNRTINIKNIVLISTIIIMAISIFIEVVEQRGGIGGTNYYISRDVFFDPSSIISRVFPGISLILLSVYDYFGFGFFYGAVFLERIYFSSMNSILVYSLPLFPKMFNKSSAEEVMKGVIDLGVRWNPDMYVFISKFGVISLFLCTFFLGFILFKNKHHNRLYTYDSILNFFILLQMLSFPIGNFVITSSSSKIIIILLIGYKLYKFVVAEQLS